MKFLLGSNEVNPKGVNFIRRAYLLIIGYAFIHWLTATFFVLYALEHLTFAEFGFLLAVQIFIQILIDYPTGTVGDWIGQKWIMAIAVVLYGLFYVVFSFARTFDGFLLAYILLGLAAAQESGAFGAWYQNNYKLYVPEDEERKVYSYLEGKQQTLNLFLQATAFILGGFTISFFSRSFVFFIQGIFLFIYVILFFYFMNDHPQIERKEPNLKSYYKLLGDGIKVTARNSTLVRVIVGSIIFGCGAMVWVNFMLFPLYEDYAKTDDVIGTLRASSFLIGCSIAWVSAIVAGKLKPSTANKVLAFTEAFTWPIFLVGISFMLIFFPPQAAMEVGLIVLLIFVMNFTGGTQQINGILKSRFFLDLIPDKNRNSIFSLIPTLTLVAIIPTNIIAGILLDSLTRLTVVTVLFGVTLFGGSISGLAILFHQPEPVKVEKMEPFPEETGEIAPSQS
ncbi:MAG: MFS transporter [Candidatus Hodarchaeales archaeon]